MDDQSSIPEEFSASFASSAVMPSEGLLTEEELSVASGLSPLALRKLKENEWLKPVSRSNGTSYYSRESSEHVNAMMRIVEAQAASDLQEAHQIALHSAPEKARRLNALAGLAGTIDPREIRTHPTFKDLLPIDGGFLERLTADMVRTGYLETERVVLGLWPGLVHPVLIDGHTRRAAAIAAGIPWIPYVVVEFPDEISALRFAMSVQCKRRPRKDDVIFRFVARYDILMERGGDRRSSGKKSKPPRGGFETHRSPSARWTANLVCCSSRKVERVRTILKDGTPEIQDAVKNGKMTINKAYNLVVKKPVVRRRSGDIKLKPWTLAALKDLGGSIEDHVHTAIEEYIQRLRGENRSTAERAEHAENEKE
ncbi:MAG: hypothetical protein AB1733_24705 [Thermodesulfobacteriota bacterium]